MEINLLYQFNEKYAPYGGVSIFSVLSNNREAENINIYILGEGLSQQSCTQLQNLAERFERKIVFLDAASLIDKMKQLNMPMYRGSYAANMRLFLDEVLEENIDRILYLDADTVVDTDLQELMQTDMQEKTIGMVLDSLGERHKLQIGLEKQDEYFNSGVILFDMVKWREQQYSAKIAMHVVEKRNNYPAPDQDLLNVVCRGDIFRLDLRYNFQPIHGAFTTKQFYRVMKPIVYYQPSEIQQAKENTTIYHCFRYLGEFPWHLNNQHPFGAKFDYYLEESPWKDYQKKKAENGIIIRIEKVLYQILPKGLFLPIFKVAHKMFLQRSNKESLRNKTNKLM